MKNKKPKILFITCCDNRIMPYNITKAQPGDLFILRNIGNIIPPYTAQEHSVSAAIEHAIQNLALEKIIICGHSDCGGMKAHFSPSTIKTPINKWLKHALPTTNIESANELSKNNVIYQTENLKTYPIIDKALQKKLLTICPLWLDLKSNSVYQYEEKDWKLLK